MNLDHMTAVDWARKLRSQDLQASASRRKCHAMTDAAIEAINEVPQLWEDDVICILHRLQTRIERGPNLHMQHWQNVVAALSDLQDELAVALDERAEGEQE